MSDDDHDWSSLIRTLDILSASALGALDAEASLSALPTVGGVERFRHLAASGSEADIAGLAIGNAQRDIELRLEQRDDDVAVTLRCTGYSSRDAFAGKRAVLSATNRADLVRLLKFDDEGLAATVFKGHLVRDLVALEFGLQRIEPPRVD